MKELWFGAWQNFYDLSWPTRFFVEWTLFAFLVLLIIKILKILGIQKKLIIMFVYLAKEIVFIIGRKRSWATEMDIKLTDWGDKLVKGKNNKNRTRLKACIFVAWVSLYACSIFVDLPVSSNFEKDSISFFYVTKNYFRKIEEALSNGYDEYTPLLKKDPPILVELNKIGKKGPKIRKEPFVEGEIIDKVSGKTVIHYKKKLEYDGERYWLKVYLPEQKIEGWLNGKLVEKKQLQQFLDDTD